MIEEPRKNCIICLKEIFRHRNKVSKRERRGRYSITCSRKCARIYGRIEGHVRNLFIKKYKK